MGADRVTCPACGHTTELADQVGQPNHAWHELSDTIGVRFDSGTGTHACLNCGNLVDLNVRLPRHHVLELAPSRRALPGRGVTQARPPNRASKRQDVTH
jgi:hypothetical protein